MLSRSWDYRATLGHWTVVTCYLRDLFQPARHDHCLDPAELPPELANKAETWDVRSYHGRSFNATVREYYRRSWEHLCNAGAAVARAFLRDDIER